ncbi:uncharacterized protein [Amphiura filiformis]|uniref:uncharacterized protein n=1 Tax=Amphiura filiformis TaxID=82378 RepID=UPI003B221EA6
MEYGRRIKANIILRHAERALLNERIRQNNQKIVQLSERKEEIKSELRGHLNDPDFDRVSEFTERAQLNEHTAVKQRQIRKLERLKSPTENLELSPEWMRNSTKDTNFNKDKWVVNLSSRNLSTAEVSVLQKGLNFAPSPKDIPVEDIITETEYAIKRLQYNKTTRIDYDSAAELRARVTGALKSAKPPKNNISKDERDALYKLRKDRSITILPAGKGRATVVLDPEQYDQKINALLDKW